MIHDQRLFMDWATQNGYAGISSLDGRAGATRLDTRNQMYRDLGMSTQYIRNPSVNDLQSAFDNGHMIDVSMLGHAVYATGMYTGKDGKQYIIYNDSGDGQPHEANKTIVLDDLMQRHPNIIIIKGKE